MVIYPRCKSHKIHTSLQESNKSPNSAYTSNCFFRAERAFETVSKGLFGLKHGAEFKKTKKKSSEWGTHLRWETDITPLFSRFRQQ